MVQPIIISDGAWLGADGENYLTGFTGLIRDGVFSKEGILNYWPAGYPLVILFLSLLGKSWVLTSLSVFQSIIFSYAAYFFASPVCDAITAVEHAIASSGGNPNPSYKLGYIKMSTL